MRFEDVSYRYKGESSMAVAGFSMELKQGSVVALLGPNGSGKSTVLGMGAGWLRASSGSVQQDGSVAFLPQTERLAFAFTCVEYVSFGRAPHLPYLALPSRDDEERSLGALAAVGMENRARRRITALSGGELQLVRIARALVQEASYVLLDEPSDMLDPAHVATIGTTIRRLADSGVGVLLSTHDLGFAIDTADEAVLMREGTILATGRVAEALECAALGELYGTPFRMASIPTPARQN
ncbi:MAG: ABC transporter ATP-binding protein [Spirochaetales bacterium]|nr:ABC transporter ATP-binding protein [Spirochaetales bacterium]